MSKTIVITGASDGIGKSAARTLASSGQQVVIIGRNPEKTKRAAAELQVAHHVADFSKLDDVRRLAEELDKLPTIDVLVNNAGGVQGRRKLTQDGYESTFQINHLSPFLLTNLLLPKLLQSRAKVINTASAANSFGRVKLDDLNSDHGYTSWRAYGTTKLENIMFTQELDRRFSDQGLTSAAFHPGVIASNFGSGASGFTRLVYHTPLKRLLGMKTVEQGADTLLWLVENDVPTWESGSYYSKRKKAHPNFQARNSELVRALWERSEQLVHLG